MHLDKTRITVRERSFREIADLGLWVLRTNPLPLAAAWLAGVLPWALLNAWLLHGVRGRSVNPEDQLGYFFFYALLVIFETPLATAPMTIYLGRWLFGEPTGLRSLWRPFMRRLPQLLVLQGLVRGLLIAMVATCFVPFTGRAYSTEVIVLEGNPLFGGANRMTTSRRIRALHAGAGGELFSRWLATAGIGLSLVVAFWFSALQLAVVLFDGDWDVASYVLFYPLALWLAVGYLAVVRFLSYIDLRIRCEGWELELLLRAEGVRLTKSLPC